jgi:predicted porin
MKKTLIAAGIAAVMAAPAAFADVKIGGQVKVTFSAEENNEDQWLYDNSLTFAASEDIGNGMTAFAEITLDTDSNTDTANASGVANTQTNGILNNKDQKVGIKGAFGTVVMGRMESLTEGKISSKFDDGASSHGSVFGSSANSNTVQLESTGTSFGRHNALAYVSPTINGFHAAVALIDNASTPTTGGFADAAREVLVAYDNGPLSVAASRIEFEADTKSSRSGAVAPDTDSIVASYKMGDAKVSVGRFDSDDDNRTDNIVRLDYKMGNNSLIVGYKDGEADNVNYDVLSVKATHHFSKRTGVWVGYRAKDSGTADTDQVHLGMIHKF